MKVIIWRITPIILVILMLTHVAYYLYASTGKILYSAQIYKTIHQMDIIKNVIKKYSLKYKDPIKLQRKLTNTFNSDTNLSQDAWGNSFIIRRLSPTKWLISSKGADKTFGTKDDITTIFKLSNNL